MAALFIEAESFAELGGWVIDQQSIGRMGSPYVMAHGLGVPVADAVTEIRVEEDGQELAWCFDDTLFWEEMTLYARWTKRSFPPFPAP